MGIHQSGHQDSAPAVDLARADVHRTPRFGRSRAAVTSAIRRPSTPTYPSKQFGSPAAAVIGSTLQFRKNSVIISLRRSNFPAP